MHMYLIIHTWLYGEQWRLVFFFFFGGLLGFIKLYELKTHSIKSVPTLGTNYNNISGLKTFLFDIDNELYILHLAYVKHGIYSRM